jgi:hypothetical protein
LVNSRNVGMVPGRKTDVADAAWIAQLSEVGLLRGSFVPPPVLRVSPLHRIYADLSSVASAGVTGRNHEDNRPF